MANISHFTQTVNGISTTYDIHDANAFPKSGGALTGVKITRSQNNDHLEITGGTDYNSGPSLVLTPYNSTEEWQPQGSFVLHTNTHNLIGSPNGTLIWEGDVIRPATDNGCELGSDDYNYTRVHSNQLVGSPNSNCVINFKRGGYIACCGVNIPSTAGVAGQISLCAWLSISNHRLMTLSPNGTWTWSGTAVQLVSDQRLKQQIAEIDDKLLDAWEDVNLVQFKYNDAVDQKGKDKARLHTGYVVQQIDEACQSHGVDVSTYGLYCHEEYPEETEEIEVEQKDGTKTKERKVIREANEHYSLRYTEVYAVECMYLRRCIKQLTARIEQLTTRIEQLEKGKEREASK